MFDLDSAYCSCKHHIEKREQPTGDRPLRNTLTHNQGGLHHHMLPKHQREYSPDRNLRHCHRSDFCKTRDGLGISECNGTRLVLLKPDLIPILRGTGRVESDRFGVCCTPIAANVVLCAVGFGHTIQVKMASFFVFVFSSFLTIIEDLLVELYD